MSLAAVLFVQHGHLPSSRVVLYGGVIDILLARRTPEDVARRALPLLEADDLDVAKGAMEVVGRAGLAEAGPLLVAKLEHRQLRGQATLALARLLRAHGEAVISAAPIFDTLGVIPTALATATLQELTAAGVTVPACWLSVLGPTMWYAEGHSDLVDAERLGSALMRAIAPARLLALALDPLALALDPLALALDPLAADAEAVDDPDEDDGYDYQRAEFGPPDVGMMAASLLREALVWRPEAAVMTRLVELLDDPQHSAMARHTLEPLGRRRALSGSSVPWRCTRRTRGRQCWRRPWR